MGSEMCIRDSIPEDIDVFNKAVREQAVEAIEESDLVLFLVDGKQGPTSSVIKI